MIKKTINIDGINTTFAINGATPRLYRAHYKRDIFKDFSHLSDELEKIKDDETVASKFFEIADLEMFENLAHIMARQGDPDTPANINDWLERYDTFSIYYVLPELLEMIQGNNLTLEESKKKQDGQLEK